MERQPRTDRCRQDGHASRAAYHRFGTCATAGFTLIELMVVIAIISVLAATLLPTLSSVRFFIYSMRTQEHINDLDNGAHMYWNECQNLYPGQAYYRQYLNDATYKFTGSQILTACLALDPSVDIRTVKNPSFPVLSDSNLARPRYCHLSGDFTRGDGPSQQIGNDIQRLPLTTAGDYAPGAAYFTLADNFPMACAICYYPSAPGALSVDQFDSKWNELYTDSSAVVPAGFSSNSDKWQDYILQTAVGTTKQPFHAGGFLLISPGMDRIYGTDDDITNFSR